jgi:hypothetical protein
MVVVTKKLGTYVSPKLGPFPRESSLLLKEVALFFGEN